MSESTRRVLVEVAIDPDILDAAVSAGADISQAAQTGILRAIPVGSAYKAELARRWRDENAEAIASHNRSVEEHGLPLAQYRRFPWPSSTPM